jgi:hypothetical protein
LPVAGNRANLSCPRKEGGVEQTGEHRIAASREEVWTALNDPDVLARCLDGCQAMNRIADDRFDARIKARVGPVRATFDAQLTLEDIEPPESYTINANVKGGPAGFARGSARVNLVDEGEQTLLQYRVNASIGGKLAQVGSRLIDGAARKMAEDFFSQFSEEVGGERDAGAVAGAPSGAGAEPSRSGDRSYGGRADAGEHAPFYESGGKWLIWLAAFVVLGLALLFAL